MGAGGRGLGRGEGREVVSARQCYVCLNVRRFSKAVMAAGMSIDTADIEFFYYPHEILNKIGFWRGHWACVGGSSCYNTFFILFSQGAARWTTRPEGADGIYLGPQGWHSWSEMYSLYPHGQSCLASRWEITKGLPEWMLERASKTSS